MAYGDKFDFKPRAVSYSNYTDGTVLPFLEVDVYRGSQYIGYAEIHLHRVKYSPHVSLGLTTRLRSD